MRIVEEANEMLTNMSDKLPPKSLMLSLFNPSEA